jgi:hypothetical protein
VSNENDASDLSDDSEGIEVVMSKSGDIHFPSGTPDASTARALLEAAVANQHTLLDRFAAAMSTDGEDGDRAHAGQELAEAITSVRIAAAMLWATVPATGDFDLAPHAEEITSFYDENDAYINIPAGEIPGTVSLHMDLERGDYDVRVRDAEVYSTGFILTVDARLRRNDERDPWWLGWLDYRLSGRWGSILTPDEKDANVYPAGWRTLPAQSGVTRGEWNFWIEMPSGPRDFTFQLVDPISDSFAPWRFSIDAATLAAAEPLN